MNFKWAVEMLKEGRKVRRKSWKSDIYFYLNGTIHCNQGTAYFFLNHFEADDWELYSGPIEFCLSDKEDDCEGVYFPRDLKEFVKRCDGKTRIVKMLGGTPIKAIPLGDFIKLIGKKLYGEKKT